MCTSKFLNILTVHVAIVSFKCMSIVIFSCIACVHFWICRKVPYLYIYQVFFFAPRANNFLSLTWRRQLDRVFGYKMTSTYRVAIFISAIWRTSAATYLTKPSWRAGHIAKCAEISQSTFCINQ